MGGEVFFDWDAARSVEGYYRIKGSTDFCIRRAIAFAPYADCIWMETGKPILSQATKFAKEYATRGAAAYVQLIQRKEREHGVETLTHQKWSGSELVDEAGTVISGGMSSTGIMSAGVTETQFGAKK